MSKFLPLTVESIRPETRHAVVVTLAPRPQDRHRFAWRAGQYLTFRRKFGDVELRRNYSICAAEGDGRLQVAIKRVEDGWFSTWANRELQAGEAIEALPPQGRFTLPDQDGRPRNFLFVAAGSGITPVLSLISTALARDATSTATLLYANRSVNSILFRDGLEDLKDLYLTRLRIHHVLRSDAQDVELFAGRLDADKCARLFDTLIDVPSFDDAYVCGPESLMMTVADALADHGMKRDRIHYELFTTAPRTGAVRPAVAPQDGEGCEVTATLDGLARTFRMAMDGTRVVDAALAAGIDAPHSCKAGVCSTCRARVTEGEVEMEANHALEDYEIRQGYVLSCQARPLTRRLALTWDA
jgi:ring-1,2-phenylacetyl-CoA epoxidase subunit PaaE